MDGTDYFASRPGRMLLRFAAFFFRIGHGNKRANGKTAGNNRKESERVDNRAIRALYLF